MPYFLSFLILGFADGEANAKSNTILGLLTQPTLGFAAGKL